MKKKITLIFLSLMILTYPIYFAINPQYAHAIGTKVATQVATQAVKEVIKDAAKEQAFRMALDEVGKIYDPNNKYKFKNGYEGYCVEVKKPDGSCDKPIQIKKDITDADQKKLDESVSKKMDQKIGGQLYNTKWGKYLDYVIPIYAVSAAGAALDYAVNGEDSILGMMNEIAMEALEDAEIIQPAETLLPEITDPQGELMSSEEMITYNGNTDTRIEYAQNTEVLMQHTNGTTGTQRVRTVLKAPANIKNFVLEYDREDINDPTPELTPAPSNNLSMTRGTNYNDAQVIAQFTRDGTMGITSYLGTPVTVYLNGEKILEFDSNVSSSGALQINHPDIKYSKIKKVISEFPSQSTGYKEGYVFERKDVILLENGDVYNITHAMTWVQIPIVFNGVALSQDIKPNQQYAHRLQWFPAGHMNFTPYYPNWILDTPELTMQPLDLTIFKKDNETITLPPIASMEYTGINGEPLTIVKDPTTGETSFQYPDASPVEEDAVQVTPGTGYTKTPEGITYTPTNPTPENPNREPELIPNNPTQPDPDPTPDPDPNNPIPPQTPPPDVEMTDPVFPEGESCSEGLKFPRLSPFLSAMENNFPLSIPFDIRNAFNAAFGEIGDEKPEWTFNLRDAEFKIAPPAFFDTFKPFTDSLLRFIFSIGMIYAIMRIMKGMN